MAKINLNNVTSPQNVSVMNDNFQKIMAALDEQVLYRDNPEGEPNQLENDLDMNGQRIYNLLEPVADNEPMRKADAELIVTEFAQPVIDAAEAATEAANAATSAAGAATTAANNANAAATAATSTASSALATANTANTTANTALTNANAAQSTANTGVTNAATAQTTANNALSTANTALSNADTAFNAVVALSTPGGSGNIGYTRGAGFANITVQDKLRQVVSVKDYGAVGDGVTNDTGAITTALGAIPATGGKLVFPAGTYVISSTLNILNKPVWICGEGADVTRIVQVTANEGGVSFFSTLSGNNVPGTGISQAISFKITDIGVHRRNTSGGSAIAGSWLEGTNDRPYFICENVVIDSDNSTSINWEKGIALFSVNGTRINNVAIHGRNITNNALLDPYAMTYGIHMTGSSANGKISHFLNGLSIGTCGRALAIDNWYEGFTLTNFEFAYVTYGITITGHSSSQLNPNFMISNGHVNCRQSAFVGTNIQNVWLNNFDAYKDGNVVNPGFAGNIIDLTQVKQFHYLGGKVQNVRPAATNGIDAKSNSDGGMISNVNFIGLDQTAVALSSANGWSVDNNSFTSCGTGIYLANAGERNRIGTGNGFNSVSNRVNDASLNNQIDRRLYSTSPIITLNGSTSQDVSIPIPAGRLYDKPSSVIAMGGGGNSDIQGYYDYTNPGNSATNVVVRFRNYTGGALPNGNVRLNFIAFE